MFYSLRVFRFFDFSFFRKNFGWGALPPRPSEFWLGGLRPPDPPPSRPEFFFSPLTTRAPPGRPTGRPAERPAERPDSILAKKID